VQHGVGHVIGVVALDRPLEVGDSRIAAERAGAEPREDDPVLGDVLVDGAARVPQLRVAGDRPGRHRRDQAPMNAAGRIIASFSATKSPVKPRPPPPVRVLNLIRWPIVPRPAAQLDRLGALALRRLHHPLVEVRGALDEVQQPEEVLGRRRLLVRRVDEQLLVEEEQAGQLAGLEDGVLAVLARDDGADLERCPLPSARSPRACMRTSCSHGSSSRPATRETSTASSPADETTSSGSAQSLGS
jgi:hypothetical protein